MIDRSEQVGRIPCLDGIRACSIIAVLLAHLRGTNGFPEFEWLAAAGDPGNLGVRVFFVVSGFLITHLLLQEQSKSGRVSLKNFFIRRAFRIFPAFYTYLLIVTAFTLAGLVSLKWTDLGYAASYTINFVERKSWVVGHLWSLAVEEQFYLIWPTVIVFFGWRRAALLAALAVLLAPVLRIGVWYVLPDCRGIITKAFPTICDTIATGCLLACLRDRLYGWKPYRWLVESPCFILVPLLIVLSNAFASHTRPDFLIGQSIRNLGIALCIDWCLRHAQGIVGQFLNLRPLVWIGSLSYSLYLWQQLFINRNSEAIWCAFPANVILAFIFACLSWYLVERPFLRARHRWFPNSQGATAIRTGLASSPES